ncbi:MAG: hypothetical protein JRG91_04660 [Deltaproteobacteria bacterium]|nr:hypothetical protein [Deltaproteobacteria bacterium]
MNTRAILAAACMIVVLAGCKQEKGESCQSDDDCSGDDLICCKANPYAIETDRGVCMTRDECDTRDASTDPGVDAQDDESEDPTDDDDALEEVTDPAPDPADDPLEDPATDPGVDTEDDESEDPTDDDDSSDATTD